MSVYGEMGRSALAQEATEPARQIAVGGAFVLQFALICVLGSVSGSLTWGLRTLGPAFVWVWILGGVLQLSVAFSLARLAAAYPLTGGCYAWLQRVSAPSVARFTGVLLVVGYVAAMADDDSGLAASLFSAAGITGATGLQVAAVALICLTAQTALCLASLRVATRSIAVAVGISILGILGVVLGLMAQGLRQGPALFLTSLAMTEHEHLPPFLLMLLLPAWTITGLDALGNFAEEVRNPARTVPRALLSSALVAFLCGTALIAVPLLATTDVVAAAGATSALLFILQTRISTAAGAFLSATTLTAAFVLPVVLQLAAARLLRAQAHDGGWFASGWLSVQSRLGVPARATLLCAVVAAVFCLGWPVLFALGTVWPALWSLAYGITIVASLHARARGRLQPALPWLSSRWGVVNDLLAALWSLCIAVLLLLFDAFHALPLFFVVVLLSLVMQFLWTKSRRDRPWTAPLPDGPSSSTCLEGAPP